MEIEGKVLQVLQEETGIGKKGPWVKQGFMLETKSQYPKKVKIDIWGREKIDAIDLWEGDLITAHVELESREYNGKYYTEVRAWKVEKKGSSRTAADAKREKTPLPSRPEGESFEGVNTDDLPF